MSKGEAWDTTRPKVDRCSNSRAPPRERAGNRQLVLERAISLPHSLLQTRPLLQPLRVDFDRVSLPLRRLDAYPRYKPRWQTRRRVSPSSQMRATSATRRRTSAPPWKRAPTS